MRSLILLESRSTLLPSAASRSRVTAIANNATTDEVYALLETPSPDGTSQLEVVALQKGNQPRQTPRSIISWTTEAPSTFSKPDASAVVSFKFLPENDSLCIVLANGDIEQVFGPDARDEPRRETVGTFDLGILAAEWSPDEELLSLITGDEQLLSMTKDFEVLSEAPLRTGSFGADAPVNVGWGSKSSQFHGSVGKSAAQAAATPPEEELHTSPDDDGRPRISWRGDSAFFAVSSLEPIGQDAGVSEDRRRRFIRVFTRVAELSSTAEPTSGTESALSWQPSGSIIATTQKRVSPSGELESHHVIFFERNGLRRYDFSLRPDYGVVKELSWNSDSSLLAVWIRRNGKDFVQLWNRNNYDWTIKQEIVSRSSSFTALLWDAERPLELSIATETGLESFSMCWDIFASSKPAPSDDGAVAVIDGANVRLTPFRLVNIPPPMPAVTFASTQTSGTPVHLCFSRKTARFLTLFPNGAYELWEWPLVTQSARGKSRAEIPAPTCKISGAIKITEQDSYFTQCAILDVNDEQTLAFLLSSPRGAQVAIVQLDGSQRLINLPGPASRLVSGANTLALQMHDQTILEVSPQATEDEEVLPSDDLELPEICPWISLITLPSSSPQVIGLTTSGRLFAGTRTIASDASSFTSTDDFLIYTTFSHEGKFISLVALERGGSLAASHTEGLRRPNDPVSSVSGAGPISRTVERGSKIVTVVPSSTALILQMPRGNLETICPRPLVLRIVRQKLDRLSFRAAFLACRRHRIDLNILYDHDPAMFEKHLPEFVSQIKDVDYLNLFLSGLKEEDVTVTMYPPLDEPSAQQSARPGKTNAVCDLVRSELESRDVLHYAKTILTAHVRKMPQDYESALRVLVQLKERDASQAEDAVKYVIFLSDAIKLFDLALGMYDFQLVLMIAQHSQKDPREYLPFLRELRQLETNIQRYRIDDHLGRHDSALRNLALAGPDKFEEALAYTKRHDLFATAIDAYKADSSRLKIILSANAEHLFDSKKYLEAGLLYALGGQPGKAITAYLKANAWQELFNLAMTTEPKRSASEIKALAVEVADNLRAKQRWAEAGRVLLEYGRDVESAIEALVEGQAFAEALRLTSLYARRDLVDTHIKAGTLEAQSRIVEEIGEVTEQVEKQVERLDELKRKRDANPDQYYCLDDPAAGLNNVELQPDGMSDAGTAFTRYTAAPTTQATSRATSQHSSRTARSRRKAGIKKAAGKKGSVYEETYLLNSIKKTLETRLQEFQTEVGALLRVLLTLASSAHRTVAVALQRELTEFEQRLQTVSDKVWTWREREWAEEKREENAQRARGKWVEKPPVEEGTERVGRPKLATTKWRIGLLEVEI